MTDNHRIFVFSVFMQACLICVLVPSIVFGVDLLPSGTSGSLPSHTHRGEEIMGPISEKQLPDSVIQNIERQGHTHHAKDIKSGIIPAERLDESVVLMLELEKSLKEKAASVHLHADYVDRKAYDELEKKVTILEKRVNDLLAVLQGVTREQETIVFSGVNVQVTNGGGSTTGKPNGLGNLIIGYNEDRGKEVVTDHSGSHNLIVGSAHSYSSYGGVAIGSYHTIAAPYASVTGGYANEAKGGYATVSGGQLNKAIGKFSTVSGGMTRVAENSNSWQGGDTTPSK